MGPHRRRTGTMSIGVVVVMCLGMLAERASGIFSDNFETSSDPYHCQILNNGTEVALVLDEASASGFQSIYGFLFGWVELNIKLPSGNSSGTVTAYYLSSGGLYHDELDFEFLGNETYQPYILQTNVFANGTGNREQRIYLWFDPTADFHTYSFLWTRDHIVFLVDGIPIRVFKDNSDIGVPYLNSKPMYLYSSLWNGDSWATQGGRIKLDWSNAPFISYFSNFNSIDACTVWNVNDTSFCTTPGTSWWETDYWNASQLGQLTWVAENYLVYDYCTDTARFNGVTPPECWNNWH